MMNKELILKAIQNPKIVRLIYRALAEDPGPLRRCRHSIFGPKREAVQYGGI